MASETLQGGIERAEELDEHNVGAILNLLGEHHTEPGPAKQDTQEYLNLISNLSERDEKVCLSVKPTQLGLEHSESLFRDNLGEIVRAAKSEGVFVWLDMEDHTTTDATLDAFETLSRQEGGGIGVCVQANLKRTRQDVERLAEFPGKVRLVKGAYNEPEELAYQRKQRVNEAYLNLLDYAFEHFDEGLAVGSHDSRMIDRAISLHEEYGTDFEFQMLMGVREDEQYRLATTYDVWQYVPCGARWLSYFYRRLLERKENLLFGIKAVLNS